MEPTHPALLDHLAVTFMDDGWSVKKLIRRIVLSRGYQLAAVHAAAAFAIDPDNRLRWRMDQRRLDAEAIRDAMLAVAGRLDLEPTPGSPVARVREDRRGLMEVVNTVRRKPDTCRSIYLPIVRDQEPEFLAVFDFPDASLSSGRRDATNVPVQGLFLLNSPEVVSLAEAFAERVTGLPGTSAERFERAFEMGLGRRPGPADRAAIAAFRADFSGRRRGPPSGPGQGEPRGDARADRERLALVAYCQALFATAEFRHLN
jgi:hypothetical protein